MVTPGDAMTMPTRLVATPAASATAARYLLRGGGGGCVDAGGVEGGDNTWRVSAGHEAGA